jgi:hypothetical protein
VPYGRRYIPGMAGEQEIVLDDEIICFDGRVLEIFNTIIANQTSQRVHIKYVSVAISEPNRKGRRTVKFQRRGDYYYEVDADDAKLATLQPLLDALKAAGAQITTS